MTDPRARAQTATDEIRQALGERLHSAVLFGSVARGDAIAGVSDINILVLLDDIDVPTLRQLATRAAGWQKNQVSPLLLEHGAWQDAGDVFAIEIADMRDHHQVLAGPDPLSELQIEASALRLQAERELRGKLIQLEMGLLGAAGAGGDNVGSLLAHAYPSFATYLRTTLRLADQAVPANADDVVTAGCALVGADPAAFRATLEARRRAQTWRLSITDPLVEQYHATAEHIAAYVDTLGRDTRT